MTRRKPLSTQVWESLSARISSGALAPGAQLPTEAALGDEYGVSRTVVREAVARLRSDGQVIARQGRGVFVNETPPDPGFQIPEDELRSLPETIALLELRMSVEVEAAGLCAERAGPAHVAAIRQLMDEVDSRHEDPNRVQIHYDYDFHLKIAEGADNAFMLAFLDYLRPLIVPRFQLRHVVDPADKERYYNRIHDEHAAIVAAIEAGDGAAARVAMRVHLKHSLERVKLLAVSLGREADSDTQVQAARDLFARMPDGGRS